MASATEICNMALGFIGTRQISSLGERTPEAMACGLYFDRARRAALRDFPWPFSKRRVQLARLAVLEEERGSFRHAYGMPPDCLKILSVSDGAEFEIRQGQGGLAIYSNAENPAAMCVMDVSDMSLWDDLFILAMAYRLAMLIAVPLLKNNSQKIQELSTLYEQVLPQAQGHAANEGRGEGTDALDSWITAREDW